MTKSIDEMDAIICYLLSKRQGSEMIAALMDMSVKEVAMLISAGERIMEERESDL